MEYSEGSLIRISNTIQQFTSGTVARGAVLSLTIRLGLLCFGFVQAVLLARLLGPTGYGVFAVTLSASSIAASLGLLGFGTYAIREVSRLRTHDKSDALRGFVVTTLFMVLIASVIGGAAVATLGLLPQLGLPAELTWGLLLTPLMALLLLLRGVSQGFGKVFDTQFPTDLVRPGFMVFALGVTMYLALPFTPNRALLLLIMANVFALVVAVKAVMRSLSEASPSGSKSFNHREWLQGALPFFGLGILVTLQGEINTLLLGWLSGPREAGLFQPIYRLGSIMVMAALAINIPLAPRISELWEKREVPRLHRIIRTATLTSTLVTIVSCTIILLMSPWILSLFGSAFIVNVPALIWIAAAQVFTAVSGPVGILLNNTGYQTQAASSLLAAVLANFILGFLLIPFHGAYGAAIAFSVSICVWRVFLVLQVWHKLGFDPSLMSRNLAQQQKPHE